MHHQQHSKYLPNQRHCYHHHKPRRKIKNPNKNIKFIWTPGYRKINCCELADHHAKNATLCHYPKTPNKNTAQYSTQKISGFTKTTNKIEQSINPRSQHKTSRKTEIIINRLRISHTRLTSIPHEKSTTGGTYLMRSCPHSKTPVDRMQIKRKRKGKTQYPNEPIQSNRTRLSTRKHHIIP